MPGFAVVAGDETGHLFSSVELTAGPEPRTFRERDQVICSQVRHRNRRRYSGTRTIPRPLVKGA